MIVMGVAEGELRSYDYGSGERVGLVGSSLKRRE